MDGVNYAERIYLAFENQVFEWKQSDWKCPRLISQKRQKYVRMSLKCITGFSYFSLDILFNFYALL
jgi:hypothetical protein